MILVVGATGHLGGMITRRLLAQGGKCACWCAPVRTTAAVEAGVAPAHGDLRQRDTLDMACRSVNTVITTAIARLDVDPVTARRLTWTATCN